MSSHPTLILASASPRRRELLDMLAIRYQVRPVDIDESPRPGEKAEDMVLRLAHGKAIAETGTDELILAADTIVVLDGAILGKPADPSDARGMLSRLQGRTHTVLTGVAVLDGASKRLECRLDRTEVTISPLDDARIEWYVDTGEPMDKAGAYAIQGLGATFVETIRGNYTNVVGLPLPLVRALFTEHGYELFTFADERS